MILFVIIFRALDRLGWAANTLARDYLLHAKSGEGVSVYAGKDQFELFAESWTIYSHPGYSDSSVKRLPEDIHNFFTTYLPRRHSTNT